MDQEAQRPRAARRGRPGHDRDAVVRVATGLFMRQGYEGTSVGDVARELGVTKSAIYHHVASKADLLALALDDALDALEEALDEVAAADSSPGQRLRDSVRSSVVVLVEHLPTVRLLLTVHGTTEVEQQALGRRRVIDQRLADLVADAVADGTLRADLDPLLISRLLFGMVNSLSEWVRPDLEAGALADAVTALAFEGLTRRSRP